MSAYQPIRPYADNSSQEQSSGAVDGSLASADGTGATRAGSGRRRKPPTKVSLNACTNCKKARAKCDGVEPSPCTRCVTRDMASQCHYEIHVKTVKQEMIKRIQTLEQKNAELEGSVKEKDQWIESVVAALKSNVDGARVIDGLKQGLSYQQLFDSMGRPPFGDHPEPSPSKERRFSEVIRRYEQLEDRSDAPSQAHLASVATDQQLQHHLVMLYFIWVHPVHMLFSEERFVDCYDGGDTKYCSRSLVTAICSLGCLYSEDDGANVDMKSLAAYYLNKSRQQLAQEDRTKLPSITAYAIFFLIELSLSQARTATPHLRLATELFTAMDKSGYDPEALEITHCGIQGLNCAWAGFSFQKPSAPESTRLATFDHVKPDRADAQWRPYHSPGDMALEGRPIHAVKAAKAFAELQQVIHATINVYCGSRGRVSAKAVISLYQRYLTWQHGLPPELHVDSDDEGALPHVYFLHIEFYVALCQLFQPLLNSDMFATSARDYLSRLTIQSAKQGLHLVRSYRQLYTNRRQPPLQAFCLVHLAATLICHRDPESPQIVEFTLSTLLEALPGFPFVGPLQAMLCQTAREHGVPLPDDLIELMGGRTMYGPEEFLDACGRLTYAQPTDMLMGRLDHNIGPDFEVEWDRFVEDNGGDDSGSTNPAFIPTSKGMPVGEMMNP